MDLINELTQGRELANHLKNHVATNSSPQECEFLLGKLFSSYEKALSMLNCNGSISSPSDSSARSENSGQCQKNVFKKRKMTSPKWSRQVRVCVGTAIDGSLDDGYSWRKYGQKEILGAKFPRAYYRCTHRKAKGCLATKQVQKSDEDPSLFEITYSGKHTCIQIGNQEPKENKSQHYPQEIQKQPEEEILFNFGTYLKNEELGSSEEIFPSFSFPSTPIESENMENNYFSLLASPMDNFATLDHHLQSSDSDITDIISAPTSVTNSPIGGLDFSIGQVDFKTSFPFDIPEYFL